MCAVLLRCHRHASQVWGSRLCLPVTVAKLQCCHAGPGYQPKAVSTPGAGTAGRSKAAGTATLTKHQRKAPRPEKGPAQPLGPPLLVESYSIQPAEKYRLVCLH